MDHHPVPEEPTRAERCHDYKDWPRTHVVSYQYHDICTVPEESMCAQRLHESQDLGGEPERHQLGDREMRGGHPEGVAKVYRHHLPSPLVHQIVGGMSVPDAWTQLKQLFRVLSWRRQKIADQIKTSLSGPGGTIELRTCHIFFTLVKNCYCRLHLS